MKEPKMSKPDTQARAEWERKRVERWEALRKDEEAATAFYDAHGHSVTMDKGIYRGKSIYVWRLFPNGPVFYHSQKPRVRKDMWRSQLLFEERFRDKLREFLGA